jgi:hypothetical protein
MGEGNTAMEQLEAILTTQDEKVIKKQFPLFAGIKDVWMIVQGLKPT